MSAPVVLKKKSSHVPGTETYREKATRKFKENPWVPLGSLATVGALVTAMVKMKRGESRSFNHWLRMRVVAQGLTIAAILAGTYSLRPNDSPASTTTNTGAGASADPTLTRNDLDRERRRVEKLVREKEEFEERLREAEETHDLEARMGIREGRPRTEQTSGSGETSAMSAAAATTSKGGWLGWLGWGRSSASSGSRPPPSAPDVDPKSTSRDDSTRNS